MATLQGSITVGVLAIYVQFPTPEVQISIKSSANESET